MNSTANTNKLTLTVKEFAGRMQVSLPTAYSLTEQRGFPVLRVGKKKLIPLAALEKWLEEQATGRAVPGSVNSLPCAGSMEWRMQNAANNLLGALIALM